MAVTRKRARNNAKLRTITDTGDATDDIRGEDPTSQRVWANWKATREHLQKWREEARESYDFVAGVQWTSEDIDTLTGQQRQPITFNRTGTTIDAVSGYEINGRQDVTFMPRTVEDNGAAGVESDAARYFRQECDAEDEESDAFYDTLVCGLGCVEQRMDYDTNPEGMLALERTDPLEMGYDPAATKRNLVDRRWDIRGTWIDRSKAKEKWKDADFSDSNDASADDSDLDEKQPISVPENAFYRSGSGPDYDRRKGKVFILEMTWFELEPFYSVADPQTGNLVELDDDKHAKLKKMVDEMGQPFQSVKRTKRKFKRAYVHGQHTLEEGAAPCPDEFHYQFMTGKRDKNRNYWFGLVRAMKDPQRWANKWMSQQLHIINSNAKGGIDYEKGAFEDVTTVERNQSKPGAMLPIEAGYFDKVRRVPPAQIPPNVFELMQFAIVSLRDVTGVNVETLGTADRNQPGVLEHQRKQSAMTILAPLFDSLRRYRKASGRLTLYFIHEFLSDGRLVRIVGEGDAQYVPLTKKDGFTQYDVIVDQSPTAPNQKEAAFASIMQMLPGLMKMGVAIPPEVLDYVPGLPQKLADVWKKALTKGPSPEESIRKLLEGMQALAEIEKTGTESEKNRAAALKDTMGIQLNTTDVIGNLMLSAEQMAQGQAPQGGASPMGHNGGPPMPPPGMPPQMPPPGMPPQMPPPGMGAPPPDMGAMPPPMMGGPMPEMPMMPPPMEPSMQMQGPPMDQPPMGPSMLAPEPSMFPPMGPPPMELPIAPPPPDPTAQAILQMGSDFRDGMMALAQVLAEGQAMMARTLAAPTELIRGDDGKAIGARKVMQELN